MKEKERKNMKKNEAQESTSKLKNSRTWKHVVPVNSQNSLKIWPMLAEL